MKGRILALALMAVLMLPPYVCWSQPSGADPNVYKADLMWSYSIFGSGIGKSNIAVAEQNGRTEIYLGGSTSTFGDNNFWHVIAYNEATGDFDNLFTSTSYDTSPVRRIVAADTSNGSGQEILIALRDGTVEIYDQVTKALLITFSTDANGLNGMAVADVDADGDNEVIVCDSTQTYVYSSTGMLEWSVAAAGGADLAVGNMDADASLEIACASGHVIDVSTQTIQWERPAPASQAWIDVEAADIDGDGIAELIGAQSWYTVQAFDIDAQTTKWSISLSDIASILVTDVDDDGVMELIVGEGQWGDVMAFDTQSLALEWSMHNPEHGVTHMAVLDVMGNGQKEILWGSGATSTGEDHLYVGNWATEAILWQNFHLDGPFIGPVQGDLTGDKVPEIVVVSWESDSGYSSGRILVFDAETKTLIGMSAPIVSNRAWTGTHDLKLVDVDLDGRQEILIGADYLYNGVIEIYDFNEDHTFSLNWTNNTRPIGAPFYSISAADIDNDGSMEIIGGVGREHTGADGIIIYVYDYVTGDEEWRSDPLAGLYWDKITSLYLADTDGDSHIEIVCVDSNGTLHVFDGATKAKEAEISELITAMTTYSIGSQDIIVTGDDLGQVRFYTYNTATAGYEVARLLQTVAGPVEGLSYDPANDLLGIGSNGTFSIFYGGHLALETKDYGIAFGKKALFDLQNRAFITAGSYCLGTFQVALYPDQR